MIPLWLPGPDQPDHLLVVRIAQEGTRPAPPCTKVVAGLCCASVEKVGARSVYQGFALDWPRLRDVLQASIADLFPDARLVPIPEGTPAHPERTMTALPVQLETGPPPELPWAGWTTPLRFGLSLAWLAALVALAAVGLGGWSLLDLSERRIRFVSAVTHELRTPLTTLRLYLDLLSSGMVRDEKTRDEYLATLNGEADRLHRLISNVLDFARLEKQRATVELQSQPVCALLEQVRQTWLDRCGSYGKELVIECGLPEEAAVRTDGQLVQQILGNLIDNARKYSRDAADPRIWLRAAREGPLLVLEVEDRGPGIAKRESKDVFQPFRRGRQACVTAGGVGLGLALARRWAGMLGGRLVVRATAGEAGACFRLELPAET
jgi:signal transduction histidine kinase